MMYSPTNVYYIITTQCNQRCSKCSHWRYEDNIQRLPVIKFIRGIKSIPTLQGLCITGGEPLLFKNEIYDILNGFSDIPMMTTIITNGVLMDKVFIENIIKHNIHIIVSIDTIDEEFWKFVRGVDSYEKVLENLECAITLLNPTQISIQSVLSKETKPYLSAVSEYAVSRKIYHSIQNYIPEILDGSWTVIENKQTSIHGNEQQCFSAGRNLTVWQNGEVYTCFQQTRINDCQEPLGNLNEDNMVDILSSEYVLSVSEKMKSCNLSCKVLKCNTKEG